MERTAALKKGETVYRKTIAAILAKIGRSDIDPRHVEAYMSVQFSTFDSLSYDQFVAETKIGVACIEAGGTDRAEKLAQSFGL